MAQQQDKMRRILRLEGLLLQRETLMGLEVEILSMLSKEMLVMLGGEILEGRQMTGAGFQATSKQWLERRRELGWTLVTNHNSQEIQIIFLTAIYLEMQLSQGKGAGDLRKDPNRMLSPPNEQCPNVGLNMRFKSSLTISVSVRYCWECTLHWYKVYIQTRHKV